MSRNHHSFCATIPLPRCPAKVRHADPPVADERADDHAYSSASLGRSPLAAAEVALQCSWDGPFLTSSWSVLSSSLSSGHVPPVRARSTSPPGADVGIEQSQWRIGTRSGAPSAEGTRNHGGHVTSALALQITRSNESHRFRASHVRFRKPWDRVRPSSPLDGGRQGAIIRAFEL